MLSAQKTPKKKIILYTAIILVMIAGNFFIYYSNNKKAVTIEDEFIDVMNEDVTDEAASGGLTLGQTVLEHNVFISLKKVGDWPIVPSNIGKADPFAPFVGSD